MSASSSAASPPPAAAAATTDANAQSKTRFSFYNAEEYKVSSPNSQQQPQRFHFYNANEIRLTETVLQTVQDDDDAELVANQNNTTGDHKMDSTEILKSLQEHEQQRLSILSGTSTTVAASTGIPPDTIEEEEEQPDTAASPPTIPPLVAAAIAAPVPPAAVTTTNPSLPDPDTMDDDDDDDDVSLSHQPPSSQPDDDDDDDTLHTNPYQEAIHEALELLRRQKTSTSSETSYTNTAGRHARQERLQQYSARLQELKQNDNDTENIDLAVSDDAAPAVERVLLAILQSASGESGDLQSQDEERDLRRSNDPTATTMLAGRTSTESESYDDEIDPEESVLGPLGQDTTGVVLDDEEEDVLDHPSSATSCQSEEEEAETSEQSFTSSDGDEDSPSTASSSSSAPTHILDSLSAAVSYMTGGVRADGSPEEEEDDDEEDTETAILRSLCAHLIPQSNIPRPQWDESNTDELGYRIVRISNEQLERMEEELQELLVGFPENDNREKGVPIETAVVKSPRKSDTNSNGSLEHFPGIKASGGGEMGDLEYFVLPVIYKSHVTGFEPVKDMVLEPGNVLAGQYLVEGVLGSAAFSTAYKCVDLSTNSDVCLKVIKNTKDFFDQSLDEIKILELLRQTGQCHENFIVEMKTFFYHREHLIIVTELLRQNLFEFGKFIMDSGEEPYFTLPRLAYVTRQCLISLRFVHSLGLVHSDVKPENILLSSYSRASVKLIDFGSSCYLTDRQSSYIQSRSYRAPEVCLGLPYDGRIDVWSLGCVVAEMFTGEVTFQNDSIVSMLSRIESICGAFPRHMIASGRQSRNYFTQTGLVYEREKDDGAVDIFQPKETSLAMRLGNPNDEVFLDFIRQLLTIDPELRPTAAQALEHPWMQYAEGLTEDDIVYPQP